ncbi:hypothetical protein NX059_003160 [Plenodomus lindquistii]|nr:hypothetical protein NX059_003160 [Plenodomus lindquistii]
MAPSPVHIIGLGNLGKLLAHSLRRQHPELPITLLFHRPSLVEEWKSAGRCIDIVRGGISNRQSDFTYEYVSGNGSRIQQLIVATKTHATVRALQPIRHRLDASSTLLFLQNGIGTIDEVTTHLFPDTSRRPKYLAGIFNHGVYATSTFSSVHAGVADAVIGPISSASPASQNTTEDITNIDLANAITACPELSTSLVSPQHLLQTQLQKLTINAVINPLTVIFNCKNGQLFTNPAICSLISLQIHEIATVIQHILTSSSQNEPVQPDVLAKFTPERLKEIVFDVGERTASNISSMRQDRLAGRTTEIEYINGWVVKKAGELGVQCPLNERIVRLVKDGKNVSSERIAEVFPLSS